MKRILNSTGISFRIIRYQYWNEVIDIKRYDTCLWEVIRLHETD